MSCIYCGSTENLLVGAMTDICQDCAAAEAKHDAQMADPSLEMVVDAPENPRPGGLINIRFVPKKEK